MQLLRGKKNYESDRVFYLPVTQIVPNRAQPRVHFDEAALAELAGSIRRYGVLQPLTVRRSSGGGFELVAGERRLRAARMAGLKEVPCLVSAVSEEDAALLALIENIQRRDLNYMEEAAALQKLIAAYGLSQEQVAEKLGRSQSAVANKLRLLKLSPECAQTLLEHGLTERHARALLRLEGEEARAAALEVILQRSMNVAQTEEYIESCLQAAQPKAKPRRPSFIIKDVRLFLNSINHSMDVMRRAGVDAKCGREETEDTITLTICIPKNKTAPIA